MVNQAGNIQGVGDGGPEWSSGLRPASFAGTGSRALATGSSGSKLPPALNAVPDLLVLLKALQNRWPLALSLGVVAALLATVVAWQVVPSPKYRATTMLKVSSQTPKVLFDTLENKPDFKVYLATQKTLITTRMVLSAALRRPEVAGFDCQNLADPVGWLEHQISVDLPANSELICISITGERPNDLATLVNAVADAYMEEVVTKERKIRLARYEQLQKLYADGQAVLTEKRAQKRKLAENVGSDNRDTLAIQQQATYEHLALEKRELQRVRMELKRQRVELAVLEAAEANKTVADVTDDMIEDALAHDALIEKDNLRITRIDQEIERHKRVIRNHSDYALRDLGRERAAAKRILSDDRAKLRPQIAQQLRVTNLSAQSTRLADLRLEAKMNAEMEQVLQEEVDRFTKEAQSFNSKTLDLGSLQDDIAQRELVVNKIGNEVQALNVELTAPERVEQIQKAESPRADNPTKRLMMIAMAGLGAMGCTFLGVSWREYCARRLGSVDEVVNGLGLRLVGALPALPRDARSVASSPRAPALPYGQSLLIESIDAARTMLLRDCRLESHRVLMITSASKGEGKSSLSSHLALSLARTGRRTLLVDLDLRSPALNRLFDLPEGPGVSELLRGEAALPEVVQPVVGGLDVIGAGKCDAEALRALAQDRLPWLFDRFRERYDFIVVDSAPVLPVADSLLISQHVDAAIFSVYREVSRLPAVYAGYERLAMLGTRILGVVVTGIPADRLGAEAPYVAINQA